MMLKSLSDQYLSVATRMYGWIGYVNLAWRIGPSSSPHSQLFSRTYRLSRDELRYILDPADVMDPDYPSETFRVLKEKEIHQHGEYRTRRLVLAAWDRMEASGKFRELGL